LGGGYIVAGGFGKEGYVAGDLFGVDGVRVCIAGPKSGAYIEWGRAFCIEVLHGRVLHGWVGT
jgi:hypothetical protein